MAVWGGLTKSCEKKKSEKQRRMGKIYLTECRVPETERRNKEAFLIEKCKEIEENNRMGKTRKLFKKTGDSQETFHERMGNKGQKW